MARCIVPVRVILCRIGLHCDNLLSIRLGFIS